MAARAWCASSPAPGLVNTRISDSSRNRPESLRNTGADSRPLGAQLGGPNLAERLATEGLPPAIVAGQVLDAIREERFYILTDDKFDDRIRTRMEDVLARNNPTARLMG